MGFKKVYKALQEIFPEVDSRALRAVAIEHQKDADAAVEAVLTEVIPFFTERSVVSNSSSTNVTIAQPPKEEEQHFPFYDDKDQTFHDAIDGLYELNLETKPDNSTHEYDDRSVTVGPGTDVTSYIPSTVSVHENGANAGTYKVSGAHAWEETPLEDCKSSAGYGGDEVAQLHLKPSEQGHVYPSHGLDHYLDSESVYTESFEKKNLHVNPSQELDHSLDSESIHTESFEKKNAALDKFHSSLLNSEPFDIQICDLNKELDGPVDTALNFDTSIEMVDVEDNSVLNSVVSRSGQIFSIDILEDIVADARKNKKTLLSAVDIVLGLMKDVEAREKVAVKAKDDAINGGLDILKRVEDLKQMLQRAKEANDMYSGEVYGEKAILSTEVRELHSRLLCMSEERDRSLKIFDEMRQSLEERLAAAEKEIEAAEKEKLEREDTAQKMLKQQAAIMDKVAEEANLLKQEAEENAKLREFLIDRGRVVDMLQGEISVICKDMRLLKEKFDARLPLSNSLTSSQMGCILASSISSTKSVTSAPVDQVSELAGVSEETVEKIELESCFNDPNYYMGEEKTTDDKVLAEEGWEIFDNRDAYI